MYSLSCHFFFFLTWWKEATDPLCSAQLSIFLCSTFRFYFVELLCLFTYLGQWGFWWLFSTHLSEMSGILLKTFLSLNWRQHFGTLRFHHVHFGITLLRFCKAHLFFSGTLDSRTIVCSTAEFRRDLRLWFLYCPKPRSLRRLEQRLTCSSASRRVLWGYFFTFIGFNFTQALSYFIDYVYS